MRDTKKDLEAFERDREFLIKHINIGKFEKRFEETFTAAEDAQALNKKLLERVKELEATIKPLIIIAKYEGARFGDI